MKSKPNLLEVVVTARPSWARVRSLVKAYCELVGTQFCRITLVGPSISHRYGDITSQIPDGMVYRQFQTLRDSDDLSSVTLSCVDGSDALARLWATSPPDCVLIIADRTETLGVAVVAAIMQIPLIHLQGGEISGSIDDKIRDTNSKLSDLHLTTNQSSRDYLLSIGEPDDRIVVVGCPSLDIVNEQKNLSSSWQEDQIRGVGCQISPSDDYGIVMFHPDTLNPIDNERWVDCLIGMVRNSKIKWFWFWPNPDHGTTYISKRLRREREARTLSNAQFIINLNPEVFVNLALSAKVIVGNSSFGVREASYIGLPAINIGERQKGRVRGPNIVDIGILQNSILIDATEQAIGKSFPSSNLYGDGQSGLRAAKYIETWTPSLKI